jgi:succinyl-CoA synthetase beta subunit
MKLFEYEAKNIFSRYNLPVPKGWRARFPDEAKKLALEIGKPVVVKSQVLVAGRGKAGGIKFANNSDEAESATKELLGLEIKGTKVRSLLIEEKLDIKKEYFLSVAVDRSAKCYTILASSEGGVDIEEVAEKYPEKIIRYRIDPIYGFNEYEARKIAKKLGFDGARLSQIASIAYKLARVAVDYDAELVEINPLVEDVNGNFVAADARIIVDDNSLFRHPELEQRMEEGEGELTALEIEAKKRNLAYVDLDGDIGIMGNGAGLVMATLDLVQLYGGRPANFLDIGGGADVEATKSGLKIVLSKPSVKVVLINILGGITRCDEVAKGITETLGELTVKKPLVIRIVGTREDEGKRVLSDAGIKVLESMTEAVAEAVKIARGS